MTDGITKQFEIVCTYDVIRDVIVSNITDPLTGQEARASTDYWIFDSVPDEAKIGQAPPKGWKFPILIIDYPDVTTENISSDGSKQKIANTIRIRARDRERRVANQLADQAKHILETTSQSELRKATLHGPDVVATGPDDGFIGGNKFRGKAIEFRFGRVD